MLKVLSPDQFKQQRRKPLLDYKLYLAEAQDLALRIRRVAKNMACAEWMADKNAASVMRMTNSRAINALNCGPRAANECTRHSPYSKTLKIVAADRSELAALVAAYLDDWYAASKREPYYDSLKKGSGFRRYWSWESAAITFLLEIGDGAFAYARFYPTDLAQFARAMDLKIPRESQ